MSGFANQLPLIFNRISWLLLFFFVGYMAHANKWWPYPVISAAQQSAFDLSLNALAYAGMLPTRHVFPEPHAGQGVTVLKPDKMAPGLTFTTGFFDKKHVMKLIESDGTVRHRWDVSFLDIFDNLDHIEPGKDRPPSEWFTHIHGAYPLSDGSVIFNFDQHGSVKVDACGKVQWTINRMTHHSVSRGDDGTFWIPARAYRTEETPRLPLHNAPFFEDQLLQVTEDGKILKEISLPELAYKNDLYGAIFPTGFQDMGNQFPDYMHTNDAQVLTTDVAAAFPMFEAGDIAVSMRQLNLVFVFDPKTEKVKWYQNGPWWRQHDPDFTKEGLISIFNNRSDDTMFGDKLQGSRITAIDPATRATKTLYEQSDSTNGKRRFFTNIMGKHETLENGNILITESLGGRLFEVTPGGEIVWEYINRFAEGKVALVTSALRFPKTYFTFDPAVCRPKGV